MKKTLTSLLFIFIFTINVKADSINKINMDIFIESNGDAKVTEVWDATISSGTEGYKPYYNIGEAKITNFSVTDENGVLYNDVFTWNISASFEEKANKHGINYIENGLELCWGISNYGNKTYTLKYTIEGFVTQTTDKQMIFWTLIPYELSSEPENVSILISSSEYFSDNIPVWGYGNYGGTAYVYDGKIEMNSDGALSEDEYMTILVELPLNLFETNNILEEDFEHYFLMAEEGKTTYVDTSEGRNIFDIISGLIMPFIIFVIVIITSEKLTSNKGKHNFKKIISNGKFSKDDNYFRDIPCDKNIYYAYYIASSYIINKKDTDFLGALILSWIKKEYVTVQLLEKKKLLKTQSETSLILNKDKLHQDISVLEKEMFDHMFVASKDGVLESKEFEKYCGKNYKEIIKWFDDVLKEEKEKCIEKNLIVKPDKMFAAYTETQEIYEEAKKLNGLKIFFLDFASMDDKSAIEVHLWDLYLQYAQIFGIADKVAKEFNRLYPDVITDVNYNSVIFVNSFSTRAISSATTAQSRAQAYSSGGGGFSSGGGGGGSFGGGGGGGGFR